MWVRKRIEIKPTEILRALFSCATPGDEETLSNKIEALWNSSQSFVCLSVRSGFDMVLRNCSWEPNSEIIMSGLNIPDMTRIVKKNGFVPVGVDVDPLTLAPCVKEIERNITDRSKAIVIAHLFGSLVDLDPISEIADKYDLMLIEDCAQAYVGNHFQGHAKADISMFSFGPIKTNTALAGAIFNIRLPELMIDLKRTQKNLPMQTSKAFAKRLCKYSIVKAISTRPASSTIAKTMIMLGKDHDQIAAGMARGFPGVEFFTKIRKRPSLPLLKLLYRRLQNFDHNLIPARTSIGEKIIEQLKTPIEVAGSKSYRPTNWVFAILSQDPDHLVNTMWANNFDATNRSSLALIRDDKHNDFTELTGAQYLLDHMVLIPIDNRMKDATLQKMIRVINESELHNQHA